MTARVLLLAAVPLLFTACDDGVKDDSGGDDTGSDTDTGSTNDSDTGKDTGKDTDTGSDTDTSEPTLPTSGYFGPPTVIVLAEDGAGGASIHLVDPKTSAVTPIPSMSVSATAALSCGAQLVWVLDDQGGTATDMAYGLASGTATVNRSIDLGSGFAGQSVMYIEEVLWFGGLGSANIVSYDASGTAGTSVDLSAYADADGKPEVTTMLMAEGAMVAVLRRENTTSGDFESSMVVKIDMMSGTITESGTLAGRNAGRVATGMPGGLAVDMRSYGTDQGGIERFDLAANASLGRSVEYGTSERVGATTSGTDGTLWVALKSEGVTTLTHYVHDGTVLDTPLTASPSGDLLATYPGGIMVGVDSTLVPYTDGSTTAGTAIDIGAKVIAVHSCTPPPVEPDTGDTGVTAAP